MIGRRATLALPTAALPWPSAAQTRAQAWLVLGFPPGGLGDIVSRPLVERLRGRYAQTILFDHRPGAGGRIAAEYVKGRTPDGATILQVPGSVMTLYPHIHRTLRYDPLTDFAPIVPICTYTYCFTAGPGLPAPIADAAAFLAWARANPSRAAYGIPASGSPMHFAGMILGRESGVDLTAVPYRGGAPLLQDLLGGQVPVSLNVLTEVLPHIREGRLRALGVASAARSPYLPEVPSLAEQGFPAIDLRDWLGWFAPAGTPSDVVARLSAAVHEARQTPGFADVLARNALGTVDVSPQGFAEVVRRDHAAWAPVVRATGFTADD